MEGCDRAGFLQLYCNKAMTYQTPTSNGFGGARSHNIKRGVLAQEEPHQKKSYSQHTIATQADLTWWYLFAE